MAGDPAARWVAPLFDTIAKSQLPLARQRLLLALKHAPADLRVQMARLDLPMMEMAQAALYTGPVTSQEGAVLDRGYDAAKEALTSRFGSPAALYRLLGSL